MKPTVSKSEDDVDHDDDCSSLEDDVGISKHSKAFLLTMENSLEDDDDDDNDDDDDDNDDNDSNNGGDNDSKSKDKHYMLQSSKEKSEMDLWVPYKFGERRSRCNSIRIPVSGPSYGQQKQ